MSHIMSNTNDGEAKSCDSLNSSLERLSIASWSQKNMPILETHEISAVKKHEKLIEDDRSQYFCNEHEQVVNNGCDRTNNDSGDYYFLDIESEVEFPLNDGSIHSQQLTSSSGIVASLNKNKDSMHRCHSMTQLKSPITGGVSHLKENNFYHTKERPVNFPKNDAQLEANGSMRRVHSQSILKSSPVYDDVPRDQIQRTASFGTLEIREYRITLGDNPGGTRGPPVSLSWKYDKELTQVIPLEMYENMRSPRREREEMHMAENMRRWRLLRECRCSMSELDKASKTAESVRKQRKKSLKEISPVSMIKKKVGKMFDQTSKKDKQNSPLR